MPAIPANSLQVSTSQRVIVKISRQQVLLKQRSSTCLKVKSCHLFRMLLKGFGYPLLKAMQVHMNSMTRATKGNCKETHKWQKVLLKKQESNQWKVRVDERGFIFYFINFPLGIFWRWGQGQTYFKNRILKSEEKRVWIIQRRWKYSSVASL